MTKKTGEAAPAIEEISVEMAQVAEAPAQTEPVDIEAIKAELEEARKATEQWKTEAKTHQRVASQKAQEAQAYKETIGTVNSRIDVLAEVVESALSRSDEEIDETPRRKSGTYKEKVSALDAQSTTSVSNIRQQQIQQAGSEILRLTTKASVDFDKAPELRDAYVLWLEGNIEDSVDEVRKVVSVMTETNKTKPETDQIKTLEAEIARLKKVQNNELDVETALPSGNVRTFTRADIKRIAKESTDEEYAKLKPEIDRAMATGAVKD